jgi:hypothetical protein
MKRLCFLLPDVDTAHGVVDDLRGRGVADADIYVVANDKIELGDLPDAGNIEKSDFYPQLVRGLATGGTIGVIGGLVAMRVAGAIFGGGAVLLFGLIGAGVNALLAAMAGAAFPNSRLTQFEKAIESGSILVMVNVLETDVDEIDKLVKTRHPEAEIEGFEPHTPLFPHARG